MSKRKYNDNSSLRGSYLLPKEPISQLRNRYLIKNDGLKQTKTADVTLQSNHMGNLAESDYNL